ncbi:MAG: DNA-binding transcriptional regulator OxyR, partial [Hyphomicrobium sp.]
TLNQSFSQGGVHVLRFSDSNPSRQIAMCWRKSSAREALFLALADLFRTGAQQALQDGAQTPKPLPTQIAARRKLAS